MSKNTSDTKFRKIDVDLIGDKNFNDEGDETLCNFSESEVTDYLAQGKINESLKYILANSPNNSKNAELKKSALNSMIKTLNASKVSQIDGALANLNSDEIDLLMQYIYRCFEFPKECSSNCLFNWFEKVFAIGKYGAIIRTLTEKKRI